MCGLSHTLWGKLLQMTWFWSVQASEFDNIPISNQWRRGTKKKPLRYNECVHEYLVLLSNSQFSLELHVCFEILNNVFTRNRHSYHR